MTSSPLSAPPLHSGPFDRFEAPNGEGQAQRAAASTALRRAAGAGKAAAVWVREPAGRQGEEGHARALERVAEAGVRASGREIVPGGDGVPAEELRYTLAADVVLGASHTTVALPELHPGERMPLITVCAVAAALPSCGLTALAGDLAAAGDARALPVRRPRALGSDHGDPLDRLAYRGVVDSAAEAFETALHHQDGRDEEACAQALHTALAAELNLRVVKNLGGANGEGTGALDRPVGPAAG
ncbi:hypothetical protein [Kitasatospora sp. NPDC008115]|uniref:hypothetical protein n=1 Tax=Kitasatospora sp. NPDC008115 TaxID=3364022 RepID=UPI0036F0158F